MFSNQKIALLIIGTTFITMLLTAFVIFIVFAHKKIQIKYLQEIETIKLDYEKNFLQSQLEIQEQTFQNIAREIHDNIGLSLTLAKLHLNTIDYTVIQKATGSVDSSIELISKAISDLSDISKSFNTEAIKTHGLYNVLKIETEKINRSAKHQVEFTEEGNLVFLDANKELVLYRIAQEALNNILKHANASCIWIKLVYEISFVSLSIEDNGTGFDNNEVEKFRTGKMHTGLKNIRTRTKALNGECIIKSRAGSGTTIFITAPY